MEIIKSNFRFLIGNLIIISYNIKMAIVFLLFLPIIFYIIKIQLYIGILFFFYYLILFIILFFFLKTEYILSCNEIPLNTSRLKWYSLLNIFIFVPRAKAFLIFYNVVYMLVNKKKVFNFFNFLSIMLILLIIYLLKISILIIIGYTYLSLLITSDFVIKLFDELSYKYESKKAMYQHIILNCVLDNAFSVGTADESKIIIRENEIRFNMLNFFNNFFSKLKNPEDLIKIYNLNSKNMFSKIIVNGHMSWKISSTTFKDKNLTKNLTSSKSIDVIDIEGNKEKIICRDTYFPNLKGEGKPNSLTPTYELNEKTTIRTELKPGILNKMNNFSKNVFVSILNDKDEEVIKLENNSFHKYSYKMIVKEYTAEYKIPFNEYFDALAKFENENKDYLQTEEGKQNYDIFKKMISNTYQNDGN